MQRRRVDVVIVGARVAGAATAAFLASQGLRVLLLDRGTLSDDPLSTHALMRLGVLQLSKLGVLDRVFASGAPQIRRTVFAYDGQATSIPIHPARGIPALVAPRRSVLDPLLVQTAQGFGAEVELGCRVVDLIRHDSGRVAGVVVQREGLVLVEAIEADWVVGADGASSVVARMLAGESRVNLVRQHRTATMYTYLDCEDDAYHWLFEAPRRGCRGRATGIIPTHDGKACVFFGSHPEEFAALYRRDPIASMRNALRGMSHAGLPAIDFPPEHVPVQMRYFHGARGFLRDCIGAGWALVGDAGYFKDPATAHGISDALRDAELVTHALLADTEQERKRYQLVRDDLSISFLELTDRIASLECEPEELATLHRALSREMKREVEYMNALPRLTPDSQVAA